MICSSSGRRAKSSPHPPHARPRAVARQLSGEPMTSIRISVVAASLLLAFASAAAVAADHVVVTNGPTAPVPVLVTNPQGAAAQPVQKSFFNDVFPSFTTSAVPAPGAGKRFV